MTLPVVFYLFRDIFCRWWETPFSLLAKVAVVAVLAGMAAVILISFHLSALDIRRSLEDAGSQSVVVHDFVSPLRSADSNWVVEAVKSLRLPVCHRLDRVTLSAETDMGALTPVFLLDADDSWLQQIASEGSTFTLFSDVLPVGGHVVVRLEALHYIAIVRPKQGWVRRLSSEDILVGPRDQFLSLLKLGQESLTYMEIPGGRKNLEKVVSGLRKLTVEAALTGVMIRDPLQLLDRLDELESSQATWRASIALGFGCTLALVLGVVAFLEFRERRFVCALLTSFGLHPLIILGRYAADALIVANGALLAVFGVVLWISPQMLPSLGFSPATIGLLDSADFFREDGLTLLVFVNGGALLSMIPTAIGLGKPVGKVLS